MSSRPGWPIAVRFYYPLEEFRERGTFQIVMLIKLGCEALEAFDGEDFSGRAEKIGLYVAQAALAIHA